MPVVAYLGPQKTNTHFAALKRFGAKAKYIHSPTIEDVFKLVEQRQADFGVVPIENSLEGSVTHTLDRFIRIDRFSPLRVYGEIVIPIQHYFITRPKMGWQNAKAIFSHPQALDQCRPWIQKHFPRIALIETSSTSEAVKSVRKARGFSAIGRKELADDLGLRAKHIPLDRDNRTRFLILSAKDPRRGMKNKTSLMFALKDKPGALHAALVPFKKYKINLTKIESRPTKRKAWEYVFFVDFVGHQDNPRIQKALEALERYTAEARVLGSYPVGALRGRG